MPFDAIRIRLEQIRPAPGRMQPVRLRSGAVAVCDDFKAGIETVHAAIDTLEALRAGRRIVVLGSLYRPLAPRVEKYGDLGRHAARSADHIVLVGRKAALYKRGFKDATAPLHVDHVRNIDEAIVLLSGILAPEDVVLIKGRGEEKLGRIALALAGRPINCRISFCPLENILCQACPYGDRGGHTGACGKKMA
jgi:UDP-N-acetylmuramyl pentapeptide synthase